MKKETKQLIKEELQFMCIFACGVLMAVVLSIIGILGRMLIDFLKGG
jgi:hypothetical protein